MLRNQWLAAVLLGSALAPAEAANAPRNILLLIGDDHGRALGCYGNQQVKTPNLDRLAADGVRFSHAFATVASCSPSRSVLYTGLYNHTNGQYGLQHAEHHFVSFSNVKTLPALLKERGYRTAIIGKEHVGPREIYPWDEIIGGNPRDVKAVAVRARDFFAESADRPFCLVVGFTDSHRAAKGFGNDRNYPGVPETRYDPQDVQLPYFLPDQPEVREELADYYRSVSRLDHGVGLVLDALKQTGRDKETLVIYLSDNGIPFPGAKTTVYDSGVNLPLIVSTPTLRQRGLVNPAMVSWVDIAPTLLDWAGAKPPAAMPGRSFLPILDAADPKGWDKVYLSHTLHEVTMYYPMRGVRTRQYKYIWNIAHELPFPHASDLYHSKMWQGILQRGDKMMGKRSVAAYLHRPKEELYDLTKDPNELKNLADDPAHARIVEQMRKDIRDFQERTNDPWIVRQRY